MRSDSTRSSLLLAIRLGLYSVVASILAPAPTFAQVIHVADKLLPNDGASDDSFGNAVAISGTTAVVGADNDDDNGTKSGSAYLFDTITGEQIAKLLPNDGAASDYFGISVAISGTTAVVGAYNDDDNGTDSGSAYLFDTATGVQIAKLLPNDGAAGDGFGGAVAISGSIAIVGAFGDDDNGDDSGSAYLFDTTTGEQIAKLLPRDGAFEDVFGVSVGISGNTAIVGASRADDNGANSGSAYLFDVPTGKQIGELLANDGAAVDGFGGAVAISGSIAIVGASHDDDNGNFSGSAYLFDTSSGEQIAKLVPNDGGANDLFGNSVAISGTTAIVGAYFSDDDDVNYGSRSGSFYLFDATTGLGVTKFVATDADLGDEFGGSVAISGTVTLAGASGNDDNGPGSGSVYIFDGAPSVAFRNAGTNPASFTSGTAWIGTDLTFTVDLTTTGHTHALVVGFDGSCELLLGGGQTLLCLDLLGNGELINTGFHEGPLASIDLAVPHDHTLVGLELYAQALHAFGVIPFALSNSQDLVVGGCTALTGQMARLLADDGLEWAFFGYSVGISGATAIVGAQGDDDNGTQSGSAYLYDTTTGQYVGKLLPSDGTPGDQFGHSVAISGTTAVVGAHLNDDHGTHSGAAYVFDTMTGEEIAKLLPRDGAAIDLFGGAVAISGTTAIVGAHRDDDNGNESGSAYLFDTTTGEQIAKLLPRDGASEDRFGYSVGISGNTAIVGAFWDDENTGSAYLFDVATGQQIGKLLASDGAVDDNFGYSVAISGTIAIVGAYLDGGAYGSAYLFDTTTGEQIAKLLPIDGATGDWFGISVAISGTTAIVGAWFDDYNGLDSGSAYLFDTTTGEQVGKLLANGGAAYDRFGNSVAISGTSAIVGAYRNDDNGSNAGSAYLF